MTEAPGSAYPTQWEADVLVRDGHPVHMRPITPQDGVALRAFHDSLSGRTVYFRFFSAKPRLTDKDVHYFTEVDHHDRVALIALDAGLMIGVGRFDALGDGTAEVAFVIRDDVQGLGLGSVLLEHLAAAARECGIHKFVAEVLPENHRMLATFREAGFEVHQHREEDVLAVSFDINQPQRAWPDGGPRAPGGRRSVERLLHPGPYRIVGASRAWRPGQVVLRHPSTVVIAATSSRSSRVDDRRVRACDRSLTSRRPSTWPSSWCVRPRRPRGCGSAGCMDSSWSRAASGTPAPMGWRCRPIWSASCIARACGSWVRTHSASSTPIPTFS
jgi:GNAT superfamily N-acetyltransferase